MSDRPRTTRDDFEMWLFVMDDRLEEFISSLPQDVGRALDYSPESLDVLEAWLLRNFPDISSIKAVTKTLDGAARYVGETFRLALGGGWDIELENTQDVFYELPVLTVQYPRECPHTLTTTSLDRRTGDVFRRVLTNMLAKQTASKN